MHCRRLQWTDDLRRRGVMTALKADAHRQMEVARDVSHRRMDAKSLPRPTGVKCRGFLLRPKVAKCRHRLTDVRCFLPHRPMDAKAAIHPHRHPRMAAKSFRLHHAHHLRLVHPHRARHRARKPSRFQKTRRTPSPPPESKEFVSA
jgi:hypothetical protein